MFEMSLLSPQLSCQSFEVAQEQLDFGWGCEKAGAAWVERAVAESRRGAASVERTVRVH